LNQPDNYEQTHQARQVGLNIDVKRLLFRIFQYWYLVALSLLLTCSIAYFKTRYAPHIYPVTASILIKEKEQSSEGRLLYNNPLVSGFRNYLNELYIIRSYPLVQRTLEDLNFGAAFYREGNVLTSEEYPMPVRAKILKTPGGFGQQFHFTMLNDAQFRLTKGGDRSDAKSNVFNFNDTVSFEGTTLVFSLEKTEYIPKSVPFLFAYTPPSQLAASYVGRLKADWAEEGSGVVNLSIQGTMPRKEIDFMQGLIKQYQNYDLEKKNMVAFRTITFITDQLTGISDSLHFVERKLEKFKDQNLMTDLSSEAERLYTKLEPLEEQKVELILHNNYFKYLTDYVEKNTNLDQVILPSSIGLNDGILTNLLTKMIDLQLQLKMSNKPGNPLVIDSRRMIGELRKDILESVHNQQSTDKIKQDYLDKQIRALEKQLNYLPVAERKLVSIQRNYSLLENLYIFLLQKRAEAGISKASTTTDIEVVNPPMLAGGPISPQPFQNYLFAILIGLGIPTTAFVVLELLSTKVQSKQDVEKITAIPFIAGIGHKHVKNNLEVFTSTKSAIAESFRALRSNLSYFLGNREKAVFVITSSISGEGKTFTSINLASVFALSEKRTLIVGADMRKPKIFQDFDLSNNTGLSTFLSGMTTFDEIVQPTQNKFLDLVSGGPVPPNPAELLLAKRMESFLDEAKKRYDYIIIDTPPLAIVTDAFALTRFADHTLFLVRQNYTPKALMQAVNDFYVSGKLKNISIVLNDIAKTGPGYGYGYGDGYGYGYGYGYGKGNKKRNGYGYYTE